MVSVPVPRDNYEDAKALHRQFEARSNEDLFLLDFTGSFCLKLTCGSLTEDEASKLYEMYRRGQDEGLKHYSTMQGLVLDGLNMLMAGGALLIAVLKFRQKPTAGVSA